MTEACVASHAGPADVPAPPPPQWTVRQRQDALPIGLESGRLHKNL